MKISSIFRFDLIGIRILKLYKIFFYPKIYFIIFKGIIPAFEHEKYLKSIKNINTLVDCGSNKGQFAILSFVINNYKNYIAFDPLLEPTKTKNFLNSNGVQTFYKRLALSNKKEISNFFITERNDSSSLKKPNKLSSLYFSDVYEIKKVDVDVNKLDNFFEQIAVLQSPRILKIDVQGNEFELLEGSTKSLILFEYLFIECTYFGLYENINHKTSEINDFLLKNNFLLIKEYNFVIRKGKLISSDRLYKRSN